MDKSVSVVIPFYNHWELTHNLLFDLYTYNKDHIDEIILVDDASTDDIIDGGIKWWKGTFGMSEGNNTIIRHEQLPKNAGFLHAANYGMSVARGDIKILISNDVSCKCGFVVDIARILEVDKTLVGGKLLNYDTGWNTFYGTVYPYLEGWLLACTKHSWDELMGFDDRFMPNDYEDVDLSTKALSLGYGLQPLNNPKIIHAGGKSITYGPEREKLTRINQRKFEAKWIKAETS